MPTTEDAPTSVLVRHREAVVAALLALVLVLAAGYVSVLTDAEHADAAAFQAAPACSARTHGSCVEHDAATVTALAPQAASLQITAATGAGTLSAVVDAGAAPQLVPGTHVVALRWNGAVRELQTPSGVVATTDDPASAGAAWQAVSLVLLVVAALLAMLAAWEVSGDVRAAVLSRQRGRAAAVAAKG